MLVAKLRIPMGKQSIMTTFGKRADETILQWLRKDGTRYFYREK